jgi:hypothetical protein
MAGTSASWEQSTRSPMRLIELFSSSSTTPSWCSEPQTICRSSTTEHSTISSPSPKKQPSAVSSIRPFSLFSIPLPFRFGISPKTRLWWRWKESGLAAGLLAPKPCSISRTSWDLSISDLTRRVRSRSSRLTVTSLMIRSYRLSMALAMRKWL